MTQETTRDTTQDTSRAAGYRRRAADLEARMKDLSPDEQADVLRHLKALLHMAAIDDWASSTPRARLFNEYKLNPRPLPPTSHQAQQQHRIARTKARTLNRGG